MSDASGKKLITIGGRQFRVVPLTLGVLRRNVAPIRAVMAMKSSAGSLLPSSEEFEAVLTVVGLGVEPVLPEQDFSFLSFADGLDIHSGTKDVLLALTEIMTASAFLSVDGKGDSASGESQSAAPST